MKLISVFVSGTVVVVTPSEAKKHSEHRQTSLKSVRRAYKPHRHLGGRRWGETGNHKWKAKYNRCVD
jgi:hypothetical protein